MPVDAEWVTLWGMGALKWEDFGTAFWQLVFISDIRKQGRPRPLSRIAAESGVSVHTLRDQEKHQRLPSFEVAQKLAVVVGISEEELLPYYRVAVPGSDA